jgi:hypothetical protein
VPILVGLGVIGLIVGLILRRLGVIGRQRPPAADLPAAS